MKKLTFKKFQKRSVKRSDKDYPQCKNWLLSQWSNALAGESGEVCNATKKIERDGLTEDRLENLGEEIADVISYCAILAEKAGLELDDIVVDKYNKVSKKIGLEDYL